MKKLYILGAGGCGRETLLLLRQMEAIAGPRWQLAGFLDDTEDPLHGVECGLRVVGTIRDYFPAPGEAVVMAVADPAGKEKIAGLLGPRGAVFETVIHPYASMGLHNSVGEGSVLYGGFGMTVNVRIGRFCTMLSCTLGHDVRVGDYSTVSSFCHLMGHVRVGEKVFIGGNAAIAPHAVVEDGAFVGVGSVVLKRVRAGEKVCGNPAREIGF